MSSSDVAQLLSHAEHAGASVEDDSLFGQHQAGGVPTCVGMVTGGAEQVELHGILLCQQFFHDFATQVCQPRVEAVESDLQL